MKKGDLVLVRKPKDVSEGPGWARQMDKYDNTIQKLITIDGPYVYLKGISTFTFSKKWLTKV